MGANNEPDEESVESEDVVSDDEQDLEEVEYESDLDDMVELTDEQSLPITMKKSWHYYKPKLLNDYVRVAYLLSPHPEVMKRATDPANRDPLDNIAVETLIEKLLVFHDHESEEEKMVELLNKITTFWSELSQFVNKRGVFFTKAYLGCSCQRECTDARAACNEFLSFYPSSFHLRVLWGQSH